MNKIVVFGATGQQGGAVVNALLQNHFNITAFVRDTHAPQATLIESLGAVLAKGNLDDPASIKNALVNAEGVFVALPSSGQGAAYNVSDEDEIRFGETISIMSLQAGVKHLIYSSAIASGKEQTGIGHFDSKSTIEAYIKKTGISYTIIRPATFIEMLFPTNMEAIDKIEFFMQPYQKMQFIAVEDIGKIVAAIFKNQNQYCQQTLAIAGDETTGLQLEEIVGKALGRSLSYQRFPDHTLKNNAFLKKLADLVDDGRLAGNADIGHLKEQFQGLLSIEDWLKKRLTKRG